MNTTNQTDTGEGNAPRKIHWQSLGRTMEVVAEGAHFEAVDGDFRAIIYWHGNESTAAQTYLWKKVKARKQ